MKQLILILFCVAGAVTFSFGQTKTSDTTANGSNYLNHKGHAGTRPPVTVYEKVVDDTSNYLLHKGHAGTRIPVTPPGRKLDTLKLPFRDDFSYKSDRPDTSLWIDDYAYINNTYPTNQLSYGVATLDGLNQYGIGFAYSVDSSSGASYAGADSLTSMPIDLSPFVSDTGRVYLSFAYEPQGFGDYPSITTGDLAGDSLILEISENDTTWDEIWTHDGYPGPLANPTFSNVIISIDSLPNAPAYFRRGVQFRFRNYANILGNNNHWHLDYVYMNSDRNSADTTYRSDLTFLASPGGFLKNYTAMPWTHFYNYQGQEIGDSAHFCVSNSFNAPVSPTINMDVTELRSNTPIPTIPFSGGFTVNSLDSQCFTRPILDSIDFTPADSDSVVMRVRTYVDLQTDDFYPDNDTVYTDEDFFNYFAYDDGSAEKAYGLAGEETSLLQFAYQFHLNHVDTLRAILINFTTIDYNTNTDLFSVFVWKSINASNDSTGKDSLIYEEDYRMPLLLDSINGFATFTIKDSDILDSSLKKLGALVLSDTFYIGWQQTYGYNIEVGYDVNDDARQHMFYNADGVWQASSDDSTLIPGAPMLRPLVGKDIPLIDTYINQVPPLESNSMYVYPNPVSSNLYATYKVEKEGAYSEIYDLMGRLVSRQAYNNNAIDVSALLPGLYLLRFTTPGQSVSPVARFVKM